MTSESKARIMATVVIAGAGCALSRALAHKLAEEGAEVIVTEGYELRRRAVFNLEDIPAIRLHEEPSPAPHQFVRQARFTPPRKMQSMLAKNRR